MKKRLIKNYLQIASQVALPTNDVEDWREFWLGCVGLRTDGAVVSSRNGTAFTTDVGEAFHYIPDVHAERRTLRKMDWGGVLFVARLRRGSLTRGMARPCGMCRIFIKSKGIIKVYYTINSRQYGCWSVKKNIDVVHSI